LRFGSKSLAYIFIALIKATSFGSVSRNILSLYGFPFVIETIGMIIFSKITLPFGVIAAIVFFIILLLFFRLARKDSQFTPLSIHLANINPAKQTPRNLRSTAKKNDQQINDAKNQKN